jgi:uncharacterized damage-inducible protein DinB
MLDLKPLPTHYSPFYAGYINQIPEQSDVMSLLRAGQIRYAKLLAGLSEEKAGQAYSLGKWTIKQVVGHLADTERIFAYRALRLYRGDPSPLPGFDQDLYVDNGHFNARTLTSLAQEWYAVREATLQLIATFTEAAQLDFVGQASGGPMTARAMAFIMAGHELHHLQVLEERYGVSVGNG